MLSKLLFTLVALGIPLTLCSEPWGDDANLAKGDTHSVNKERHSPMNDGLIRFHRKVLTHADGPRSHYRPTSAEYMRQAIAKYGFLQGYIMGADRLMRENSERWVYPTILIDGKRYKYDPP